MHEFVNQGIEKCFTRYDLPPHGGQIGDLNDMVVEVVGAVFLVGEASGSLLVRLMSILNPKADEGDPELLANHVQQPLPIGLPHTRPADLDEFPGERALLFRRLDFGGVDSAGAVVIGSV